MSKIEDWARKAAAQIFDDVEYLRREDKIAERIIEACPFQRNTAYMPVPRCDGCKHWDTESWPSACGEHGDCAVLSSQDDIVMVDKDFGCVQWEKK